MQLENLLKMAELPHASVRILPFHQREYMGATGLGRSLALGIGGRLLCPQNGGRLIDSPREVRELSVMFDRIGVKAASEEASREIIKRYLESYA